MKILTVDDDFLIRKIIRRELEPAGYQIHEASNGKECIEKLQSIQDFDLITLDIEMPVMNGFDVLAQLNKKEIQTRLENSKNADVPIILVTSNDTKKVRDKGFSLGAANFVVKPFAKGELLLAVNKLIKPNDFLKDLSVLVTDDSKTLRKFIVSSIMELGVTIYEADDGIPALELLKNKEIEIDLVITDLNMKRLHGDDLCKIIRNDLGIKDIPIIFLSSNEDRNKQLELFKIGATDYISKPFFKEELLARMYVHLEHRKMNKMRMKTISDLKAMKRFKDKMTSLFSQNLRPPLQSIIDSAKVILDNDYQKNDLNEIMNHISSSSQAILYKINNIYNELNHFDQDASSKPKSSKKQIAKSILVIEAKKMDTLLLTMLLKDHKCKISSADNASKAISAFQKSFNKEPFQIIFLDMDSSEINGMTTLKIIQQLIKENNPSSKPVIVAVAKEFTQALKDKCHSSGIKEMMTKPIKRLQLKSVMEKYL